MKLITLFASTLLGLSICAQTAVVNNPSDVSYVPGTLRYEIANAVPGTTIYLTSLTSPINLQNDIVITKNVKLIGTPGTTIIDGNLNTNLFVVNAGMVLEMVGLTLQEGSNLSAMQVPVTGQAVNVVGNLIAKDCVFKDNLGHDGGAIWTNNTNSEISLTDCLFQNNTGRNGGAIRAGLAVVNIIGCSFIQNNAIEASSSPGNGGNGGAIWVNQSKVYIINSIFRGNVASGFSAAYATGGAINVNGFGKFDIANSLFHGNSCNSGLGGRGGAINFNIINFPLNTMSFYNLTVTNNNATHGGGITINSTWKFDFGNCIIAQNHSAPGQDPDLHLTSPSSLPTSKGGNLIGIIGQTYTSLVPSILDQIGSLASPIDPMFMLPGSFPPSVNGDYHLKACSPAMNTGHSSCLPLDVYDYFGAGSTTPLSEDLEGNNRIIGTLDKGAYEHINAVPGAFYYTDGHTHCKDKVTSYPNTNGLTGTFTSSPAGLYINATTGVITRKFSAVGQYTITFTTTSCTGTPVSSSITYTINPLPVVTITQVVNPNFPYNTLYLNAVVSVTTGPHSYRWYRNGAYLGSSSQLPNPCSNATYEVYVKHIATGCEGYASLFFNSPHNGLCSAPPPPEIAGLSLNDDHQNNTMLERSAEVATEGIQWNVYPNPATENVTVIASAKLDEISIMSIDGKLLQTIVPTEVSTTIDIEKLSAGTYFIVGITQGVRSVKELVIE
ncbi:MAG: T9SS type A sorting domain-containing protein [Bacteroidota bacterium]